MRLLGVFWLVMSVAGLVVQELFSALGRVPRPASRRHAAGAVGLNATTVLDGLALAVFAVLYWLSRHQERLGGGAGYAP